MRIGIDIDGVMCDLMRPVVRRINNKYHTHYRVEDITEWNPKNWENADGKKIELEKEVREFLADATAALTPFPIAGAFEAVTKLQNDGHSIIFVTGRQDSPDIMNHTLKWMQRYYHNPQTVPIMHTSNKAAVEVDLFIDDNYDIACDIADAGRPVILVTRPWNINCGPAPVFLTRLAGWDDILGFIGAVHHLDD